MKIKFHLFALAASCSLMAAVNTHAETVCSSSLEQVRVRDDIVVRRGSCEISNSDVRGDIKVTGGVLEISDSVVRGGVTSDGGVVRLSGGVKVKGDVDIRNASDTSGIIGDGNNVKGDVTISGSEAYILVHNASIGGDLTLDKNAGGANISANSIRGTLACSDNDPAPTGFDNGAKASRRDGQCIPGAYVNKEDAADLKRAAE